MPFLSCMPVSPTYAHYKERPLMPSRNLRKRTSSQAYFNLELLPRDALTHQAGDVHVAWFNSWLLALQALSPVLCALFTPLSDQFRPWNKSNFWATWHRWKADVYHQSRRPDILVLLQPLDSLWPLTFVIFTMEQPLCKLHKSQELNNIIHICPGLCIHTHACPLPLTTSLALLPSVLVHVF